MADYLVNIEAYKQKCINKAKPMLHCNGKCQMLKKIKKQESNGGEEGVPKLNQPDWTLSSKSFFPSVVVLKLSYKNNYPSFNKVYKSRQLEAVFHPPTV
jgi:hypothetical protein